MYHQAVINDDFTEAAIFAGEGVGLIKEILPAREIIKQLVSEFDK